jgi:hypothetical protein
MATVFLASKAAGAMREKIPSLRRTNVYAPVLRWIGLGVGAAVLLVGGKCSPFGLLLSRVLTLCVKVLSFFLPTDNPVLWGGIYGCIAAVVVLIMQSGFTFVNRILGFLLEVKTTFLVSVLLKKKQVFYWRALIYIALSIGCYFTPVLIVGGILLDLLAIAYIVIAYFFKEREYYDAATIAREQERAQAKQRLDADTRGPVHV